MSVLITLAAVALRLISFHGVEGSLIDINPEQVTSLRAAREGDQSGKYFTNEVHCMIGLTDGKFVTVTESCEEVRSKLEAPQ